MDSLGGCCNACCSSHLSVPQARETCCLEDQFGAWSLLFFIEPDTRSQADKFEHRAQHRTVQSNWSSGGPLPGTGSSHRRSFLYESPLSARAARMHHGHAQPFQCVPLLLAPCSPQASAKGMNLGTSEQNYRKSPFSPGMSILVQVLARPAGRCFGESQWNRRRLR